jgi:hypothetical protein
MSLACSNLFGEMSKRGHSRDLCRQKNGMKIGAEERETEIVHKHVEWPLPSLRMAQRSMPGSLLLVNFTNYYIRRRATNSCVW